MALSGSYYSNYFTSELAGDLMEQFRDECGHATATLKKLTLITDTDVAIKINGGEYSHLYLGTDSLYSLSLDARDIVVSSIITEDADVEIFLAGIF